MARILLSTPGITKSFSRRPLFQDLSRKGFVRARIDAVIHRIEEAPELERYKRHTIEAVVDRLKVQAGAQSRL